MDDIEEHQIELSQFDMDHLNAGMPVYKGIGEDIRLVLYSDDVLDDEEVSE